MRILAVNADRGIAPDGSKGASIHLRSVLNAFVAQGNSVLLHSQRPPKSLDGLRFEVKNGVTREQLVDSIESFDADVVFERYSLDGAAGIDAALQTSRLFALEVNSPLFAEASLHRPTTITEESQKVENRLWREADFVFPVSTYLQEKIQDVRGHSRGLVFMPNGVCQSEFTSVSKRQSTQEVKTLAFLGHPKPWHGTALLLEAMESLVAAKKNVRLLVIGGGPGGDEIRARFEEAGLGENLEVTGPLCHEDAIVRLSSCDLSLAPYAQNDSFYFCPLKVIESLAAGVPLVASLIGDIEFLTGGHARLCRPGDAGHLAESIVALLEQPEESQRMARAGREHVLKHHTWKSNVRCMVEHIESLRRGQNSLI